MVLVGAVVGVGGVGGGVTVPKVTVDLAELVISQVTTGFEITVAATRSLRYEEYTEPSTLS
jgi:hypothetical protein